MLQFMKDFLNNIRSDKTTRLIFIANFLLIIITLILIGFYYRNFPPFIPIFNQLPWGEQRLGSTITIFIPPLISLFIFILNIIITSLTYEKIPLVARMVAVVSFLVGILVFLFIIKIIQLVI